VERSLTIQPQNLYVTAANQDFGMQLHDGVTHKLAVADSGPQTETSTNKLDLLNTIPPELRIIIWELSVPPRRVMNLAKAKCNKVPTVFHLCRESRHHMMKSYARISIDEPPIWSICSNSYAFFFNYDIDDLFLDIPDGWPKALHWPEFQRTRVELRFLQGDNSCRKQISTGMESDKYAKVQRVTVTQEYQTRSIGCFISSFNPGSLVEVLTLPSRIHKSHLQQLTIILAEDPRPQDRATNSIRIFGVSQSIYHD
jgi:hypothetical protein